MILDLKADNANWLIDGSEQWSVTKIPITSLNPLNSQLITSWNVFISWDCPPVLLKRKMYAPSFPLQMTRTPAPVPLISGSLILRVLWLPQISWTTNQMALSIPLHYCCGHQETTTGVSRKCCFWASLSPHSSGSPLISLNLQGVSN